MNKYEVLGIVGEGTLSKIVFCAILLNIYQNNKLANAINEIVAEL